MKLMKAAPLYGAMRQDLDRLMERFFEPSFWPAGTPRTTEAMWEPTLDFSETEKEFVVRLEAPGMARDDFDVDLDGNLLALSGKREFRTEEKGEDFLYRERQEGRFLRTLRLPAKVDEKKVEAIYVDGILTVKLPKMEQLPKTKVPIK